MKHLCCICLSALLFAVGCSSPSSLPDINAGWNFSSDDGRSAVVDLPHDAMLGAMRSADAPGGGGEAYFQGGKYTYTKTLEVPAQWLDMHAYLSFDGVYRNAKVYVNDELAGGCDYGYLPFEVGLDGLLCEGTNTIRVEVDNSAHPNSRWYPGGGIYRPVKLCVVPREHVKFVRVKTVSINPAVIEVEADLTDGAGEASVEILDGKKVVAKGVPGKMEIPDAKLWSADFPHLYTARVTLPSGDVREEKFGIRSIEWSPEGFLVNGENVLLRGGCIHHDNGIVGSADYEESAYRRIATLKKYGFNAIRSAHNPVSENILKACDELGLYVMDEMWDMWFHGKTAEDYSSQFMDNWEKDMEAVVRRDFNHPSVVLYSIGNELSEPAMPGGMDLMTSLVDKFHSLDPSRPVTAGINLAIIATTGRGQDLFSGEGLADDPQASIFAGLFAGDSFEMSSTMYNMIVSMVGEGMSGEQLLAPDIDAATTPVMDALDISGYNYGKGRYEAEGALHPDRIVVGSETFPIDLPLVWPQVERMPYLVGDFMWTAWDYLGEVGIGAWSHNPEAMTFNKPYPWLLADTGALDILGNPNGEALLARSVWTGDVSMAVQPIEDGDLIKASWRGTNAIPSWSWRGKEGQPAVVEVYTRAQKVRLSLNGEPLGEAETNLGRASFTVPYAPGILKAEAYDGENLVGTAQLQSATGKTSVRVEEEPKYSKDDIHYFDIELVGENGEVVSTEDRTLTVRVEGGVLLGFGSAQPRTEDRFQSGSYTTYYGRAQAIVRGNGKIIVE